MKKIINFCLLIILLVLALFAFSGCAERYEYDDIKNYIENDIGIKDYQLSESPVEKKGSDDYSDYYWHVKYKEIEFDVCNDYYWGMEIPENRLKNNYTNKVLEYYYNQYSNADKIIFKEDEYYKENYLMCEAADEQKVIDEVKLKEGYDNIVDFIKTIDFNEYPVDDITVIVINSYGYVDSLYIFKDNHICTFEEFNDVK